MVLSEVAISLVGGMDNLDTEFAARRGSLETGRVEIAAGGSTIQYLLPHIRHPFSLISYDLSEPTFLRFLLPPAASVFGAVSDPFVFG